MIVNFKIYENNDIDSKLFNSIRDNLYNLSKDLINQGADVNTEFFGFTSLLFYLCKYEFPEKNIIELLINNGAGLTVKNNLGRDIVDMLKIRNLFDFFIEKYPDKYKEYIINKETEKYNL